MSVVFRAVVAMAATCAMALLLSLPTLLYLDPYYEEYVRQCLLKNGGCPIIEWATPSTGFPVLPRQVHLCAKENVLVILRANERFDPTCRSYVHAANSDSVVGRQ